MAKVVWLGSPDGPDAVEFMGFRFIKDQAVDIDEEHLLSRAAKNQFFKVEGYSPAVKHAEPLTHRPPSEQSAQGPVPKAGDPIVPQKGPELGPPPPEGGGGETPPMKKVEVEEHHPAVRAAMRTSPRRT